MPQVIDWKRRTRRYEKSGVSYERLESTDGAYAVGSAYTNLSDDSPRHYALTRVGRNEKIISIHRSKHSAIEACEIHAATH